MSSQINQNYIQFLLDYISNQKELQSQLINSEITLEEFTKQIQKLEKTFY